MSSVIPWPWRALVIVLLLVAAGVVGWMDGATSEGKKALAREGEAQRVSMQQALLAQEQVRVIERRHAQSLAAISTDYERKINEATQLRAADRAALRAGSLRLRDPGRPVGDGSGAQFAAGTGRCDGRAPGELSTEAAEFLLGLASDADDVAEQLAACQRVVTADRQ
jgi:prophage endopeptidase